MQLAETRVSKTTASSPAVPTGAFLPTEKEARNKLRVSNLKFGPGSLVLGLWSWRLVRRCFSFLTVLKAKKLRPKTKDPRCLLLFLPSTIDQAGNESSSETVVDVNYSDIRGAR